MTQSSDPNQVIKIWCLRGIKVALFAAILLAFYLVYLDAWVQNKMHGPKWDKPIKVFARPLQVYPNLFLAKQELIRELAMLGYQKRNEISALGQYRVAKNYVELYRRNFTFIDGEVNAARLRIGFEDGRVAVVEAKKDGQWQTEKSEFLDPLLISRTSENSNEDREILDLSLVPEWMIDTLLVVEDKDFYHHHGVSVMAIGRALLANISAGRKVQGGSTLTQQLAKNLLLNDSRKTYFRKFKEALIALILDYRFSKDAILEAYFNEIYLGQNGARAVHGFALASKFYFSKPLAELDKHEFALLIAMVKGPSYYSPTRQAKRAKSRRDLVLQLMVSENIIDSSEYQYFVDLPMSVKMKKTKGRSPYPSYMQLVDRELAKIELDDDAEKGILVFTAMDPLLQRGYQKSFAQRLDRLEQAHKQKQLNGAVVSVGLDEGGVLALVGDRNATFGGFNRALNADRNIGSLVKPAVYLTALQQSKYHLGTVIDNTSVTMQNNRGKTWQPANFDKTSGGTVLMYEALSKSMNLPTVHLGMAVGLNQVASTLQKLGIEKSINKYPSLLLGAISLTPYEVAKMYLPLANYGQNLQVGAITGVTTPDGIVLWQKELGAKQVFDYQSAYELGFGLQAVTTTGTARRLTSVTDARLAGKTGTTDDLRDSWFSGFDQNRVTTVWVGKDDNSPVNLTGSQGALAVFMDLQKIRKPESISKPKPHDVDMRFVEKGSGKVLSDNCGEYIQVPITAGKVAAEKKCPSLFDWF